jgi:RimJ/RimL family protein N-acetyltransferase
MAIFKTLRLTLAPSRPNDAPDFMALERDPEVMRYLNGGHAVDHSKPLPYSGFSMPRGTEDFFWTARRTTNNAFVGWFFLGPDLERAAEIGYRLNRASWGQGLAAEGGKALIDWGFETGLYDRVFASTMAVNFASRRVMEKIGMNYVRTAYDEWPEPIPGSEYGEAKYEVEREEWVSRRLDKTAPHS